MGRSDTVDATPFGPRRTEVPASATQEGGAGMSPGMMAGIGGGAYLLGTGLEYLGQRQGARAMQDEAERQAAEQAAFSQQRHLRLMGELARMQPGERGALGQASLQRRMAATTPALQAGGSALGLNAAQIAGVGAAAMPQQRILAQREAGGILQDRSGQRLAAMGADMGQIRDQQQMAAQLYAQQSALAGAKGEGWRMLGRGLQSGLPMVGAAMGQPATGV